jgi:NADH-quinone oxidoreductase subunit A
MLSDFGIILLFIIAGLALVSAMLFTAKLLRPDRPNIEKLSTYESGEEPIGNANIQFNIRFYVVALIFVLFDVELVFLFPWATVFGQESLIEETNGLWGWFSLVEMLIFVGLLSLGLAYAWVKGYLDWVKPQPAKPVVQSNVPTAMYEKINQKYASTNARKG